jgi:hypothetical protein
MKKYYPTFLLILCFFNSSAQDLKKSDFIGVNLLQLPALTLNINYSHEFNPYVTSLADIGYAFNYIKGYDFVGEILTPHCDCGNNGYDIDKITGAYLKLGAYFNLRKSFQKRNYFRAGAFLVNSYMKEEGRLTHDGSGTVNIPLAHRLYLPGLAASLGYEVALFSRIKTGVDFQIAFPGEKYEDLYGYRNYIPGMGYKDTVEKWFPMLLWNMKYRLN